MYGNFQGFPLHSCIVWLGHIMTPVNHMPVALQPWSQLKWRAWELEGQPVVHLRSLSDMKGGGLESRESRVTAWCLNVMIAEWKTHGFFGEWSEKSLLAWLLACFLKAWRKSRYWTCRDRNRCSWGRLGLSDFAGGVGEGGGTATGTGSLLLVEIGRRRRPSHHPCCPLLSEEQGSTTACGR